MNPTENAEIESWRWLTSKEGKRCLEQLAPIAHDPIRIRKWLAKQGISTERARRLVEQCVSRPKARSKFGNAEQMFFESQLLRQSTEESLSNWKAKRFRSAKVIVDICCGLAGDLMALAKANPEVSVTGVDLNEVACHLARTNCQVNDVTASVVCADANAFQFENDLATAWFHIDPDRRPDGKRTTTIEHFSPSLDGLNRIIESQRNGAIKLAPASIVPESWTTTCEQQWIGDSRECKQLVAWFGETTDRPGTRSAAAIDSGGSTIFEWHEEHEEDCPFAKHWGAYLFEPHPTLIAGRMVDSLATEYSLEKAAEDIAYLTGAWVDFGGLAAFKILDSIKMDEAAVVEALLRHDCQQFETKKRGLDHKMVDRFSKTVHSKLRKRKTTKEIESQASDPKSPSLVLILTRLGDQYSAVIARRVS